MNKIKIKIPEQTIEVNYEIESGVQLVTPAMVLKHSITKAVHTR